MKSESDILAALRRCLPRQAPFLKDDVPVRGLALDSMDLVELFCAVHEEFGIRLTESEFQSDTTLRDLSRHIACELNSTLVAS